MIVVLGGKGHLATAFAAELRRGGRTHRVLSRGEVDYTDRGILRAFIREEKPEFLVNAAGYTGRPNVDACEADRANCLFTNAVLPGYVREVCEEAGLAWGHLSTGCIYSGDRPGGGGFTEADMPNFSFRANHCSWYGGTKALGEETLVGAQKCYIWRMRFLFNHEVHPRNYLNRLLGFECLFESRNSFSHLNEAVRAALACRDREVSFGTYHVTNPGALTTRELAGLMREESERRAAEGLANPFDREFRFFEDEAAFFGDRPVVPRAYCVLDPSKLLATGIVMRPVEEAVRASLRDWGKDD